MSSVEEQRHCIDFLGRGDQNKIVSHITKILCGLGKFLLYSLPIMSYLKGILVWPLKKKKSTRTVRKLFVGLLLIFHETLSALSIRN